MKVKLVSTIPNLGRAGELIDVSDAQARNYLIPKKLAVLATGAVVAAHDREVATRQQHQQQHQASLQALVEQLSGMTITMHGKASPQGKLFASLKAVDIQRAIEQYVKAKMPHFRCVPDHLKTLGTHSVNCIFDDHHAVLLTIEVTHGS